MTPDTSAYMVAGFIVIFSGVIGYFVSLVIRKRSIVKKTINLEENDSQ